ncbi:nitroreductase family protein, partial [Nonomuraea sp. NPDC049158]|uniref:nitroreductase family protein n=1 Tax=Nonomuraea sp. NPDC049158 TaxID=3155649 RepID=UPI0033C34EDA
MVAGTAQHGEQAIQAALQAARWAPSVHNTQPWSFGVHGDEISLRADTARKLLIGDSAGRELLISC